MTTISSMKGKINKMTENTKFIVRIGFGVFATIAGSISLVQVSKQIADAKKNSNPEYCKLKQIQEQERTKRLEKGIVAKAQENERIRNYEKTAPAGYWEYKKACKISGNELKEKVLRQKIIEKV